MSFQSVLTADSCGDLTNIATETNVVCSQGSTAEDSAATKIRWRSGVGRPLDAGGPVERPFDPLPAELVATPVFSHFARVAAALPERACVTDGSKTLTFAEAYTAALRLAATISCAVPAGKPIGVLMPNSAPYPIAMLACLAAGHPCVPLNARDPAQRNAGIVADAGLAAVIGHAANAPEFVQDADLQWIDATPSLCSGPQPAAEAAELPVEAPAIILYTSGSTGQPKGIANHQRAILQRVLQHANSCHINRDDVLFPLSGPTTIAGCREIFTALLTGARLVMADVEALGLRGAWRAIHAQGATIVYAVPTLLRALIQAGAGECPASLRVVRIGGEKVLWSDIAMVHEATAQSCLVQIGYSSTETTGAQWFVPRGTISSNTVAAGGYLLPGLKYAVVDDDGTSTPPGEVGELLIRSSYVALGHWQGGKVVPASGNAPGAFVRDHATGDLVSIDDDGLMRVVSRKDRQVKINGRRVEPEELEAVIRKLPRVRESAVIVSDANELVAVVVPETAGESLASGVWDAIRAALPSALHPTRLHEIESIPRLTSGKVDVVTLRALDRRKREAVDDPSPDLLRTLTEARRAVESAWKSCLGTRTAIGRWDEAGGDSLKLLRCVMQVEDDIGAELDLSAFTVDMTVDTMIEAVAVAMIPKRPECAPAPGTSTIFLVPGSIGNGPSLAAFGAELAGVAEVATIRYPDLAAILDGCSGIEDMAESAVQQIHRTQPEGDVRLLGYSLGGAVAFEVAARLIAEGRSVKFLGILDTNIGTRHDGSRETFRRTLQRIRAHRVTVYRMLCRAVARAIVRGGREQRVPALLDWPLWRRAPATHFMLKLESEELLRMRAFGAWVTKSKARLPIKGTLFVCNRSGLPHGLGWPSLFESLDVIPVAGGHLDMLVEPYLPINRPVIERTIAASCA
jgi:acyl-coenzyme A synthetase/AMP-(fatty) acid ligase/thioesterase domain-containing protein